MLTSLDWLCRCIWSHPGLYSQIRLRHPSVMQRHYLYVVWHAVLLLKVMLSILVEFKSDRRNVRDAHLRLHVWILGMLAHVLRYRHDCIHGHIVRCTRLGRRGWEDTALR